MSVLGQRFTFASRGQTYLLVHGRNLDAGIYLPRAEEPAYRPVDPGEASLVIRDLLSEPPWRLQALAALVDVFIGASSARQEPERIVARVRNEVLRSTATLGLFVRVERLRSLPRRGPVVPLADMVPWLPEEPKPRSAKLWVAVERKDTRALVPGVLVRLSHADGGQLAEKPSDTQADGIDFGKRAPGDYTVEVLLRGEQESTFQPPPAMAFSLAEGERKLVRYVLKPDTSFEVIFHDQERKRIAGAPFRVLTEDGAELLGGEADGDGVGRFELPSSSTESLTLEWSETCEDGETYVQNIFTDTKTERDELDEVRLTNLGYPCGSGIDPSLHAFARGYRLHSEEGAAKLGDVFATEELG